ncbi:MAG TPA: biotin carboxylase N-terminal domain-containing protein [Actinomycetota bacterium]|nr:biotin carboxylase N-terminal domain-containing protein [Actinomycetota bacterium]
MSEPKVLVANRGEIAVRVIRTCREMGIPVVAVYSDADRESLHVELADEAYHLGPAPPLESYLNMARILEVAHKARATMVHPGYGFLSENAAFARAVAREGFTFVGPPPEAMEAMGDKAAARRTARSVGAPVVPGTLDPVGPEEAVREAERIGLPVVVKAAHGGGGKGMQVVRAPEELGPAVARCAREAASYFGRPEVYLERYLARVHHVEAQVLGDAHGHLSFLGERDCSSQRRHQKLLEESPSPVVDEALRTRIGEAALAISRAVGYVNAGTVEFLVDEEGSFYFIEMNTRLQVEHPVTEMTTGLDLVRLQILVALGERVEVTPAPRGHAIECRINAEDPARDFLPGPGVVTRYRPPEGPFVRVDAGIDEGRRVPGDYDSLVAKLIVWAEDRELARRRMVRALDEFVIEGIPTTIPFHRWLLETEEFRGGRVHTRFVGEALAAGAFRPAPAPPAVPSGPAPRPVRLVVEVDGRRVPVTVWDDGLRTPPRPVEAPGHAHVGGDGGEVVAAPMQGTILSVLVEPGQQITAGQTICILEAMKMENHIQAHRDGTVTRVVVSRGDVVESGQPLAVIE